MYRRILVILLPVLGDVLLGTPLLRSLRARYPDASVDVLVRRGCGAMLEGNPDIRQVIEVEKHPGFTGWLKLLRRIGRRYDLVITNSLSDRAAVYSLVAAPDRVIWIDPGPRGLGWKRRIYGRWSTQADGPAHPLQINACLARLLELPHNGRVVLPRSPGATARVDELLEGWDEQAPLAVFHAASAMPFKHWHRDGWRGLAQRLAGRGFNMIATGGPAAEEQDYLRELFGDLSAVRIAAGKLRLGDLHELFSRASLFVGVDTCATHMAGSAGLPTVLLIGPEDPRIWGAWPTQREGFSPPPYTPAGDCAAGNVIVLHSTLPCVPCRRAGCDNRRDSYSQCLDEIDTARVMQAADRLLGTSDQPSAIEHGRP